MRAWLGWCVIAACGGTATGGEVGPAIGSPCVLGAERVQNFGAFAANEVNIESAANSSSGDPVCLADHFRGRVTCPYGQNANGMPPPGANPCMAGDAGTLPVFAAVPPQCTDRLAADVVTRSCRCASAQGATNDGAKYCSCPSGTTCTQLVPSIGLPNDTTSGAYCTKNGTAYDSMSSCAQSCDPAGHPCP